METAIESSEVVTLMQPEDELGQVLNLLGIKASEVTLSSGPLVIKNQSGDGAVTTVLSLVMPGEMSAAALEDWGVGDRDLIHRLTITASTNKETPNLDAVFVDGQSVECAVHGEQVSVHEVVTYLEEASGFGRPEPKPEGEAS